LSGGPTVRDLVYPVRAGRHDQPEWLRYSLRTVHHHLPHGRVFIVGHCPTWVDRDQVTHIATVQAGDRFDNQRVNLEAVMTCDAVADDFYWMNDDYFILRNTRSVPLFHRGRLSDYVAAAGDGDYLEGLRSCLKILRYWGFDEPLNCAVHVPMPVNKSRLVEVMTRAWADGLGGGFMRAMYGAGLSARKMTDPKVKGRDELPDLDWRYLSTAPSAWAGRAGELIRNRYWRPSPYEVGS
jgi:hypothetical protein